MNIFLMIMIALGVIAIYDARELTKKYFSSQDQNKMTNVLKLAGFLVCVICGILLCTLHLNN